MKQVAKSIFQVCVMWSKGSKTCKSGDWRSQYTSLTIFKTGLPISGGSINMNRTKC